MMTFSKDLHKLIIFKTAPRRILPFDQHLGAHIVTLMDTLTAGEVSIRMLNYPGVKTQIPGTYLTK